MAGKNCNAILLLGALLASPISHQAYAAKQEVSNKIKQEQVNINRATAKEIAVKLKGIGSKKAAAIVKRREESGEFSTIDDLLEVPGITQAIIDKNRNLIVLSPT